MPISLSPLMMRQIIMDHYENPRNKRTVDDPRYKKIHMDSASCIDDIYVFVLYDAIYFGHYQLLEEKG